MDSINIQDIFNRFYPDYLETYTPSAQQAKAALHIINCKTGAYGSTISVCEDCGHIEFHHNSCRDRNCPTSFPDARASKRVYKNPALWDFGKPE